ncbi:MAG: Uma2 family endonuclease, partial [Pyrinomonadaceae bacterium]|nr:Uma2 family endonuclease [Pyrinomonadaceae bacterium]
MSTKVEATIDDLFRVAGKAELVDGEIVRMSPTGGMPGYAGDEVFASLREHAKQTKSGLAIGDNKAFRVNLPHRKSFSPDAAFYTGPSPTMQFYEGAPVFAVEIRSENDYGLKAERRMARKRADYFAGGTLVVWDVNLLSDVVVKAYHADDPDHPKIVIRGDIADAEPAVPGWRMPVDDLFSEGESL